MPRVTRRGYSQSRKFQEKHAAARYKLHKEVNNVNKAS